MVGAGVIVLQGHRRFQCRLGFRRAGLGGAIQVPVIPAGGVHVGFGEHGMDIGIVGILDGQVTHGVQVGEVALAAIGDRVLVIKNEHGIDHVALFLGAVVGQLQSRANSLQAGALWVIRQALVAAVGIGSDGVGHTPVRHGVFRCQPGCFLVGGDGLGEVETPGHSQALVEESLGFFIVYGGGVTVGSATWNHDGQWLILGLCRERNSQKQRCCTRN